jgi:hypothetical protein
MRADRSTQRCVFARELSHFASSKVPTRAKFGTLERLKLDKSGAARGSGFGDFYNPRSFNRAIVSRNMR